MKNMLLMALSVGLSLIGVELFLRFQLVLTIDYAETTMEPETTLF